MKLCMNIGTVIKINSLVVRPTIYYDEINKVAVPKFKYAVNGTFTDIKNNLIDLYESQNTILEMCRDEEERNSIFNERIALDIHREEDIHRSMLKLSKSLNYRLDKIVFEQDYLVDELELVLLIYDIIKECVYEN